MHCAWLAATPTMPQDLVLLDPPYHENWLNRLLPSMSRRLAPAGRIYAEAEFALTDAWLQEIGATSLTVIRAGRAGQVHYHLLGERHSTPGAGELESIHGHRGISRDVRSDHQRS